MKKLFIVLGCTLGLIPSVYADSVLISIHRLDNMGIGQSVGTVQATDSPYGLLLMPRLSGLTPGIHGFHIHVNPSCNPGLKNGSLEPGLAAGGHLDPKQTGKHLGPYNPNGHLGDLPALYVSEDGTATLPVLAPRLKVADIKGHSLMIHQGGDNYSDKPAMGGGGARAACGVIR